MLFLLSFSYIGVNMLLKKKIYFSSVAMVIALTGCQNIRNSIPNAGPTLKQVQNSTAEDTANADNDAETKGITILDIDNKIVNRINELKVNQHFSDIYTSSYVNQEVVRAGDTVNVTIYEAPPALLFGSANSSDLGAAAEIKLPEQMVDKQGQLTIPFLGKISVIGKTPSQIQNMIVSGLSRKANKPSAIVNIAKNNSANVTIVGEVNNSLRMPLTGKGERVLDAIAAAGGAKYPSNKVTIQLNRGKQSLEIPMDTLLKDMRQNVVLQSGDVVAVNYQSNSFTVLGATIKNDEINFEANGISLMQALARSGGLNDSRADSRGVFIFRYETPYVLTNNQMRKIPVELQKNGLVPVIYRLNLKDPANYFIAQNFPIKNNDVIYVSNAPATEFAKFLNMVSQSIYSITGIKNLSN